MLKKSLVAVVLLTGLGSPAVAQATTSSPSLAENVQLAWVDGKVKISWTESAPIPNTIALEVAGKNDKQLGTTTADAPNQLIVPASALEPSHDPASTARIVISDPSTAEARSAAFDRYIRGATSWAPMLDRGVLSWAFAPDRAVDTTLNDPLDVDKPARFIPRLTLASTTAGECRKVQLPATTTPYGEIANQHQPFNVDMYAANEWVNRGSPGSGCGPRRPRSPRRARPLSVHRSPCPGSARSVTSRRARRGRASRPPTTQPRAGSR
jgi:hypothetical protein